MKDSFGLYRQLEERLQQQEQTITQLLAILAATNSKVTEISRKQSEYDKLLTLSPKSPRIRVPL